MKKKLTVLLLTLTALSLFAQRQFTDMAGRSVELPPAEEIVTIFTANPTASVFLYTLDYERMAGWNLTLYKDAVPLLPAAVRKLPKYGTLYGNGKAVSDEEVFAARPQLLLLMGELTDDLTARADELTARFRLPVVVLDGDLNRMDGAYRLLGEICGVPQRAEELALFCRGVIDRAVTLTATLSGEEKKTVFYSLGDGLETYPRGTALSDYMELCGAVNVVDLPYDRVLGHMNISFEELAVRAPEYILAGSFANSPANEGSVYNRPAWKALKAQVALIPHLPFDIFAKPPSANRIAGIIWLQALLYPDRVDYDVEEELDRFNRLFYGM